MKRRFQFVAGLALTGLLSSLMTSAVSAQEPGDAGLEIVELSGTLEMILGNQIKVKTGEGQEAVVLVADDTEFIYRGTAEPTALSPGLMVRFTAPFDAAGVPQAPLTELEIFRPIRARRMTMEMRQQQTPGVYPATEEDEQEQDASRRKTAAKPQPAAKPQNATKDQKTVKPGGNKTTTQSPRERLNNRNAAQAQKTTPGSAVAGSSVEYLVVGVLRAIQGDKLQVVAGNIPVFVQAAADVKVTVTAGDPLFCRPGDEIRINGLKNPAGLIQAQEIEVIGAKPLGSVDEKDQARNSRNSKRGQQAEADSDAAAKTPTAEKNKSR